MKIPVIINPVVTTGVFDGVHSGHRELLARVVRRAKEEKGESVVLTFEPHPKAGALRKTRRILISYNT